MHQRLGDLISHLIDAKLDALVITGPANWYYLTGFTGESGALVVSRKETTLITDGRFLVQGRTETSGVRIRQQKGSLFDSVGEFIKNSRCVRVGFNPTQVTVGQLHTLRKTSGARARWFPAAGMPERLRMRKDRAELAQMRRAGEKAKLTAARDEKPDVTMRRQGRRAAAQDRDFGVAHRKAAQVRLA